MYLTPPTVLSISPRAVASVSKAIGRQRSKLQALLAGKPVLQHTLDAVRASGLLGM